MAIAFWRKPYDATLPEEYGDYLVTIKGSDKTQVARFTHPNGARKTGWYQDWMGHWEEVEVLAWDHLPAIYKPETTAV